MTRLSIPNPSLVVLIGASGSGKSTFAARHFRPTEVVSSDTCRGMVADDEGDQSATPDAFDLLGYIAGKRLAAGRLTVVDATSVRPEDRKQLVDLARAHHVLPVAIVLDVPTDVCIERNASRPDRSFGGQVVVRQAKTLHRSMKRLSREGFRRVHVLKDPAEIEAATVVREPLLTDRRTETGPFDAIGDVHGCLSELVVLLDRLGYTVERDDAGRPIDARHPEGRRAIFLGDLVDRGPDSPGVLRLAMGMHAAGNALVVPGNHENKLIRALRGRNVKTSHGLAETLDQLAAEPEEFRGRVLAFLDGLVSHLVLDDGRLVVAHAGLKEAYHNRSSGRVRSFALYGDTTGETDEFGLPVRYPWANDYRGKAMVLYGHTPTPRAEWVNNTMCLDTGCVFGGKLSALRYPERELVDVPAERVWYEPAKPLDHDDAASLGGPAGSVGAVGPMAPAGRDPGLIDITDVLGRRVIETAYLGEVIVRKEHTAGALEVMSRFALDPARIGYLPPTMAACPTSTRPDFLEHPDEAFADYARIGVEQVICQEKHMGSRAVVQVRAGSESSGEADDPGVIYTRTGRSFFDSQATVALLGRVRAAVETAGLWSELGTDWLLLDTELLPWSAKAGELLRRQYAAVGAAGRSALPVAVGALERAAANGVDVADLLDRTRARESGITGFTAAYRRYCWQTDGLDGIRIAPFQLLASAGATYHDRDHEWHLAVADRLVAADPELFTSTARTVLDPADPEQVAAASEWWLDLTASGGEGMVVKPLANLANLTNLTNVANTAEPAEAAGTDGRRPRLPQPGVKCRGREYLRIIYGPDYTAPENLERLRNRSLGRKRSLALNEYALGIEALERLARDEPLWRIHECVFGVLALESEAVDPRL